jgi:crotonobetainyl-CoA:carnitine CoA-transferase CaiB-like acyl-CoA transferase
VRVAELGGGVSAAWASKWLADLGADVIKIEAPEGDELRRRGPFAEGGKAPDGEAARHSGGACRSGIAGFFHYLNANKRSVVLDLANARAREESMLC